METKPRTRQPALRIGVVIDRFPGTKRQKMTCPVCKKFMTLDSKPHIH